jgi:hypothetical protein
LVRKSGFNREFISCSPELPALSCEKNPNDIPYFAMKVMENFGELREEGRFH